MPTSDERNAILRGMRAAESLHRDLHTRESTDPAVRTDVYGAIVRTGALLIFKPLDPLLGAYLRNGNAHGIMITSRRPVGVQRFTAGHELGHLHMAHDPHADGEEILRRAPIADDNNGVPIQEREADAFASSFILPKFALAKLQNQQGWAKRDYQNPHTVYQASLRFGASYNATIRAYERERVLTWRQRNKLLKVAPRQLKAELVDGYQVDRWTDRDVWRLTEQDEGAMIEAGRNDLFLLKLKEHRGAGYLWTFDELEKSGFLILKDQVESSYEGRIGGVRRRLVLGQTQNLNEGSYTLKEKRPWDDESVGHSITIRYHRSLGRENGLYTPQLDQLITAG